MIRKENIKINRYTKVVFFIILSWIQDDSHFGLFLQWYWKRKFWLRQKPMYVILLQLSPFINTPSLYCGNYSLDRQWRPWFVVILLKWFVVIQLRVTTNHSRRITTNHFRRITTNQWRHWWSRLYISGFIHVFLFECKVFFTSFSI